MLWQASAPAVHIPLATFASHLTFADTAERHMTTIPNRQQTHSCNKVRP